jgi:hypothetical protein
MVPGTFTTYAYTLDGDTLRVTFQTNQTVRSPIPSPSRRYASSDERARSDHSPFPLTVDKTAAILL